ncbi:DUF1217 domain-containing protein [Parvularcula sp. ZS-1/3]|uniref:DUF1217 domain-containing protein n=1 Tax=Parvularcula mediterranea TaxID=2732508 RepID=A0A7Y3W672_9PROT|nr:DUF1217 domain-containing protein [Parvularcula mediterranea]NNU17409.1 DUF1217 domain-containing protein [Parvularcula mediterranea]
MTSTYLGYLTFERNYGRPLGPVDFTEAEGRRDLTEEAVYFKKNIGKVSTGAELVKDERLLNYALTAFGLSDQVESTEQIIAVLDGGIFDPFADEAKLAGGPKNDIDTLANAFWFSDSLVFDFEKDAAIQNVVGKFALNTQLGITEAQAELDYFRDNIKLVNSGEDLVRNERLLGFVLTAFKLDGEEGNSELIGKALDAGFYNPSAGIRAVDSPANTLVDSRWGSFARAFAFAEIGDGNVRNPSFLDSVVERYNRETLSAEAKASRETGRQVPLQRFNEREIQYFRENISKVATAEDLLADERLYRFALTAFDLESQVDSRALVKKVLDEGVDDENGLANKLVDKKFRDFAAAFRLAEDGDLKTRNPNFVDDVIEKFKRVKVEDGAGEDNIGVRLAAYFDRKANNLNSWFQILGDRALREVVFTALDLPDEMQKTNPDKLAEIFEKRLKLEDLNNPQERQKFIQRFTLLYDIKNGAPGFASNTLSLYGIFPDAGGGGNGVVSIDPGTLGATFF